MANILLVWPGYYSLHPPLGLLKLSAYHKENNDNVELIHLQSKYNPKRTFKSWIVPHTIENFNPDLILISSVFTWAWREVHEAIYYCQYKWKGIKIKVGGVYASLMPERLKKLGVEVVQGVQQELEEVKPDYKLVPEWKASIVFSTRGCIRKCSFCAVKKIEPKYLKTNDISNQLCNNHESVYIQDNNFLASKYMQEIVDQLLENKKPIDFNQSLDARLFNEKRATIIKPLKLLKNTIRFAFDDIKIKDDLIRAVKIAREMGIGKSIFVYALYNYSDNPDEYFERLRICVNLDIKFFPMRYEPLDCLKKAVYIGESWGKTTLRMVRESKNRWGLHGSYSPPYEGLKKHLNSCDNFNQAFSAGELKHGWK